MDSIKSIMRANNGRTFVKAASRGTFIRYSYGQDWMAILSDLIRDYPEQDVLVVCSNESTAAMIESRLGCDAVPLSQRGVNLEGYDPLNAADLALLVRLRDRGDTEDDDAYERRLREQGSEGKTVIVAVELDDLTSGELQSVADFAAKAIDSYMIGCYSAPGVSALSQALRTSNGVLGFDVKRSDSALLSGENVLALSSITSPDLASPSFTVDSLTRANKRSPNILLHEKYEVSAAESSILNIAGGVGESNAVIGAYKSDLAAYEIAAIKNGVTPVYGNDSAQVVGGLSLGRSDVTLASIMLSAFCHGGGQPPDPSADRATKADYAHFLDSLTFAPDLPQSALDGLSGRIKKGDVRGAVWEWNWSKAFAKVAQEVMRSAGISDSLDSFAEFLMKIGATAIASAYSAGKEAAKEGSGGLTFSVFKSNLAAKPGALKFLKSQDYLAALADPSNVSPASLKSPYPDAFSVLGLFDQMVARSSQKGGKPPTAAEVLSEFASLVEAMPAAKSGGKRQVTIGTTHSLSGLRFDSVAIPSNGFSSRESDSLFARTASQANRRVIAVDHTFTGSGSLAPKPSAVSRLAATALFPAHTSPGKSCPWWAGRSASGDGSTSFYAKTVPTVALLRPIVDAAPQVFVDLDDLRTWLSSAHMTETSPQSSGRAVLELSEVLNTPESSISGVSPDDITPFGVMLLRRVADKESVQPWLDLVEGSPLAMPTYLYGPIAYSTLEKWIHLLLAEEGRELTRGEIEPSL